MKIRKPSMLAGVALAAAGGALSNPLAGLTTGPVDQVSLLTGTIDGGKMFDDIQSGQCTDYVCYMTLTTSIVTTGELAVPPEFHDNIEEAIALWNAADTTIYFQLVADDPENDVRFKSTDVYSLIGLTADAVTLGANYHKELCPFLDPDHTLDCEDTVENPPPAAHQPERWWYTYVIIDEAFFPAEPEIYHSPILAHEMGHALGLGHQPDPRGSGVEESCKPDRYDRAYSIMNVNCVLYESTDSRAFGPKAIDVCGVNLPTMYGDDPAVTNHGCVGVSPPYP